MNQEYINEYLDNNCRLMPLQGKRPIDKNWTDENYKPKPADELKEYQNLGWILSDRDVVIDVDKRNNGLESFIRLQSDFNTTLLPTVKTPGGFHCYYRKPENEKLSVKKYPGIDILTKGKQVVIAGSKGYDWLGIGISFEMLPDGFLTRKKDKDKDKDDSENVIDLPSVHIDTVERLLDTLEPDESYENWLNIGMALHNWSSGLNHGLKLFEKWSQKGKKYEPGLCRKKWDSFKGSGITIATLLHQSKQSGPETEEDSNAWDNWFYIAMAAKYINAKTNYLEDSKGLNVKMSPFVPTGKKGGKPSAEKFAIDNCLIRIADSIAYLPTAPNNKIVRINGRIYFNTFNPDLVPVPADSWTNEGKKAVETVKNHLRILLGSEHNAELFTHWLAWQRQKMGKKLYWCPLIQSIEGLGKSFFGHLLRIVLGSDNLGIISPEQVVSNFNSWSVGQSVNVLEELRLHGHNRYDAATALKPLISDKIIMINEKNIRQYQTFNVTNYLVLTNHRDALPITDTDRRYWIIFSPHRSVKEFEYSAGDVSHVDYFKTLYSSIREVPGQIIKWLEDHQISKEFENLIRAPDSDAKTQMIEIERSNIEGLTETEQLILEESPGRWIADCVRTTELFQELKERDNISLSAWQKNHIMQRLGFTSKRRVWLGQKTELVWTKTDYSDSEIRELLKSDSKKTNDIEDILPF